jgi:hypothetical protein
MGFWRFPNLLYWIHSLHMLSSQVWNLSQWRTSRPALFEAQKSCALAVMVDCQILFQGDTLKETEGLWDVLYMRMSLQLCRGSVCSLPHPASVTWAYLEQLAQRKKWPQIRLFLVWIRRLEKFEHLWVLIVHGSWDLCSADLYSTHINFMVVCQTHGL